MPDVKEFHFHMELLVQMDFRRHGMAEGARMTFSIPGNFVPSAGPISLCLEQQMSEGATCGISVAPYVEEFIQNPFPMDGRSAPSEIDLGGLLLCQNGIPWKSTSPKKNTRAQRNLHFVLEFT